MDELKKRKQSFLLRLPISIRERAAQIAHEDGTSLNHFVTLAVAEKISRMDEAATHQHSPSRHALSLSSGGPLRMHRAS